MCCAPLSRALDLVAALELGHDHALSAHLHALHGLTESKDHAQAAQMVAEGLDDLIVDEVEDRGRCSISVANPRM